MADTFTQPNYLAQLGSTYMANIDAAVAVLARLGRWFNPHEQTAGSPAPDLTVVVDAGFVWDGTTFANKAQQTVTGFTAPASGTRIDRICINKTNGDALRVAGTAVAGSPSATPPAIPAGYMPCCQVAIASTDTAIVNSMITDERPFITSVSATATQAEVNAMTSTTTTLTPNHNKIVLGTEQASTSGTSIDFTGIPAGVRRITVMFVGVSTNGISNFLIQLGDAGGIEATGYSGAGSVIAGTSAATLYTAGFGIRYDTAIYVIEGSVVLSLEDSIGFTWVASGVLGNSNTAATYTVGGSKSLSAELDRVRITTVNGTDTFDAGAINISYER